MARGHSLVLLKEILSRVSLYVCVTSVWIFKPFYLVICTYVIQYQLFFRVLTHWLVLKEVG
jgi:hypothetical protein